MSNMIQSLMKKCLPASLENAICDIEEAVCSEDVSLTDLALKACYGDEVPAPDDPTFRRDEWNEFESQVNEVLYRMAQVCYMLGKADGMVDGVEMMGKENTLTVGKLLTDREARIEWVIRKAR